MTIDDEVKKFLGVPPYDDSGNICKGDPIFYQMKSVLISIRPKYCELIASGKKTVEVRKTRPKIETPFKCHIYCTKETRANMLHLYINGGIGRQKFGITEHWRSGKEVVDVNPHLPAYRFSSYLAEGKVIGKFVCDFVNEYTAEFTDGNYHEDIRQVFEDGEAIVASNEDENPNNCFLCNRACLSFEDIKKYIGSNFHENPFYGLHISDLVIYDKPKELKEFVTVDKEAIRKCKHRSQSYYAFTDTGYIKNGFRCDKKDDWCFGLESACKRKPLVRPPQSWCYAEERNETDI